MLFDDILHYTFWGFLNNIVLVLTTSLVAFFCSLLKIGISTLMASVFSIIAALLFFFHMRRQRVPKYLRDIVGLLWPLPVVSQATLGGAMGIVISNIHQQMRLHTHHEMEEESHRYAMWIVTLYGFSILQSFMFGILCDSSRFTMRDHSD